MTSSRQEAAFAVLLLLASLLAMIGIAASGFVLADTVGATIEQRKAQLADSRQTAARFTSDRQRRLAAASHLRTVDALLPALTTGVAGARLQSRVTALITTHAGKVQSARVLDSDTNEHPTRIAVEVTFESPIRGLRDVLLATERDTPFIFVDRLSVRRLANVTPRQKRGAQSREPMLTTTMRVTSFMLNQRKPATKR
ncbi:MAG: type II secretion system protein GspM [Hyphomicrobiaceae bacterium]